MTDDDPSVRASRQVRVLPSSCGIAQTDIVRRSLEGFDLLCSSEAACIDAGETLIDTLACIAYSNRREGHWGEGLAVKRGSRGDDAMQNAFNAHRFDLDSVHYHTSGHTAAVLWPLALNAAEPEGPVWPTYMYGHELMAYLGILYGTGLRTTGREVSSVLGCVSGAAAISFRRTHDATIIDQAMSIAASLATGRIDSLGSLLKPLQLGWAARTAVFAADMANTGRGAGIAPAHWASVLSAQCDKPVPLMESTMDCTYGALPAAAAQPTHFKIAGFCAFFDEPLKQLAHQGTSRALVEMTVPQYVAQHAQRLTPSSTADAAGFDLEALAFCAVEYGIGAGIVEAARRARLSRQPLPVVIAHDRPRRAGEIERLPAIFVDRDGTRVVRYLEYGQGIPGSFSEALQKFGMTASLQQDAERWDRDVRVLASSTESIESIYLMLEEAVA